MLGRKQTSKYTYIVGDATGAETDPMSLEETLQHVKSGKITGATYVKRSDQEHWGTAADYPELGTKDTALSPMEEASGGNMRGDKVDPLAAEMELAGFERTIRSGASWFFWVGALSLINSIIVTFEGDWGFALGLELTYLIGFASQAWGASGPWIGMGVNIFLSLLMLGFGVAGWQRKFWPYVIGMALYAGDFILTFFTMQILSMVIHGLALFYFYKGLRAFLDAQERPIWPVLLKASPFVGIFAAAGFFFIAQGVLHVIKDSGDDEETVAVTDIPNVLLRNDAQFNGHSPLKGGVACLVELPDGTVVALVSKDILESEVHPPLKREEIEAKLISWQLHAENGVALKVKGIHGGSQAAKGMIGGILLDIEPPADGQYPVTPLKPRQTALATGEKIKVVGPHAEKSRRQIPATLSSSPMTGMYIFELPFQLPMLGLNGAPILDGENRLAAMVYMDDQATGGMGIPAFPGTSVDILLRTVPKQ